MLFERKMGRLSLTVKMVLFSLSEALKFKSNDGPAKTLLAYMKKFNFSAPATWK